MMTTVNGLHSFKSVDDALAWLFDEDYDPDSPIPEDCHAVLSNN